MKKFFKIITLFPEIFPGNLGYGLIGKSFRKTWDYKIIDLKQYSNNGRVDDRPCGGGPGMIIAPNILEKVLENQKKIIYVSPRGRVFNQNIAEELLQYNEITFLCGRYEGIDQRVIDYYNIEEISIGDFILCGGEVAVLTILETIIRLLTETLNNQESIIDESFSNGLLEYDQYTLPRVWKNISVPSILFSGHHKNIQQFKLENSIQKTKKNRLDLYYKYLNLNIFIWIIYIYNFKLKNKYIKIYFLI